MRRHLISDVPVAAYLSGGLDTGSIVALAAKEVDTPLMTFCMGLGLPTDEFPQARLVAEKFDTDHHEIVVDDKDILKTYPKLIWHLDSPKVNLYPYLVAHEAAKHTKVILSGEGGDELFGGYGPTYMYAINGRRISKLSQASLLLPHAGRLLIGAQDKMGGAKFDKLRYYVHPMVAKNDQEVYMNTLMPLFDSDKKRLFGRELEAENDSFSFYFGGKHDFIHSIQQVQFKEVLANDLLIVDDAVAMANSLESRVPLLDNEIIELGMKIPWNMKFDGITGKKIIRHMMKGILPGEILNKRKQGFAFDTSQLYKGELMELAKQKVSDGYFVKNKYLKKDLFDRIFATKPSSSMKRHYLTLLTALNLEIWREIYFEGNGPEKKFN